MPWHDVILCDVDNCIADDHWRHRLIKWHQPPTDARYHDYHLASALDRAANLEKLAQPNSTIIFLTAMPIAYAEVRAAWMRRYKIRHELILYRPNEDRRDSVELKRAMVRTLILNFGLVLGEVRACYDDKLPVVEMYKEEGLPGIHLQINNQDGMHHAL